MVRTRASFVVTGLSAVVVAAGLGASATASTTPVPFAQAHCKLSVTEPRLNGGKIVGSGSITCGQKTVAHYILLVLEKRVSDSPGGPPHWAGPFGLRVAFRVPIPAHKTVRGNPVVAACASSGTYHMRFFVRKAPDNPQDTLAQVFSPSVTISC